MGGSVYLSQKTAKRPITIMGKKFPIIHSNTMAKMRRTGPTKKKIPLYQDGSARFAIQERREEEVGVYTTGDSPEAPPQPIMTMEKVNVEITKPTKPRAVGLAYLLFASPTRGTFGVR
jgi:hypothetical protein